MVFKNDAARAEMREWHCRFRAAAEHQVSGPLESRTFDTGLGKSHALVCGPGDAPPVVLLHGALASSAHVLHEVTALAERFRVYALDVPGQSPLAPEVRPDVNGPAYGRWFAECLDALGIESARLLGVSWGGAVALRAATVAPERIGKLSLIVPAGVVNGSPADGFLKMGLPLLAYQLFPTVPNRRRLTAALFTTPDVLWEEYIGAAFRAYRFDFSAPVPTPAGDLARLTAPVQVVAAEHDLSFPGTALLARAKELFPNLAEVRLLAGARHSPSFEPTARRELTEAVGRFFA
jgi:2-hydroxy-6-oxonona-2,4-dienedioate hydrolase